MNDGSKNKSGCSAQYWQNSTRETGERIKGGADKAERSPLNDAKDFKKVVQVEELALSCVIINYLVMLVSSWQINRYS